MTITEKEDYLRSHGWRYERFRSGRNGFFREWSLPSYCLGAKLMATTAAYALQKQLEKKEAASDGRKEEV